MELQDKYDYFFESHPIFRMFFPQSRNPYNNFGPKKWVDDTQKKHSALRRVAQLLQAFLKLSRTESGRSG